MSRKEKISKLLSEIGALKKQLHEKENELYKLKEEDKLHETNQYCNDLTTEEISRYSRQMLVPQITVAGQVALKNSKVLIVGVGGLGCPASLYLAAAGVGEITLIDYDEVEISNLHRQVLHSESDIGIAKVESAYQKLTKLNSNIKVVPLKLHGSSKSIEDIVLKNKFNVIVDGTDNVATRYLLNDVCVMNKIPLVSGSALQMEGQLTVYSYIDGPCYRCLFPVPPPPETVTNCGDGGVLGPVPGMIGVLQALETIKVITGIPTVLSGRMLIFDGLETTFRNIKLRKRNVNCDICGDNPSITGLIDYEQFCGAKAHDKVVNIDVLNKTEHIKVKDLESLERKIIIDVRPKLEFEMCKIPNTVNFPYDQILKENGPSQLKKLIESIDQSNLYILCRRGNDSQRFITHVKENIPDLPVKLLNIEGGLHAYSKYVDSSFPVY